MHANLWSVIVRYKKNHTVMEIVLRERIHR